MNESHAGMLAVGVYRPDRVVPNHEIAEALGLTEEWIESRTGIIERRFAGTSETVVSMAANAGRDAMVAAGVSDVDCLLLATSTHMANTPAAATQVAAELGSTAAAFDISAGCAGYAHAIALATAMISGQQVDTVLVIGAEKLSTNVDPGNRAVAPIFGDGAGAVVVGRVSAGHIRPTVWGSDGTMAHLIRQEPMWDALRSDPMSTASPLLHMEGTEVFRWATSMVPKIVAEIAQAGGISLDEVEVFVPHQANMRIISSIARHLHWDDKSVVIADDIRRSGNTSAAALPLAMHELISSGRAMPGQLALQVSFGAGISYAGQVFTLPPIN